MRVLSQAQAEALQATEEACYQNARALLQEARILYAGHGYVRAFFLALTGREEAAKVQLIADCRDGQRTLAQLLRAFKDHKHKFAYLQRVVSRAPGGSTGELEISYEPSRGKPFTEWRERSLYVGMTEALTPEAPWTLVTAEVAQRAIEALHEELQAMNVASLFPGGPSTRNALAAGDLEPK
jgi:AbiV family abortive infection protein